MAGDALQWRPVRPRWIPSLAHQDLLPASPAIFLGQLFRLPPPHKVVLALLRPFPKGSQTNYFNKCLSVHHVNDMLITWKHRGILPLALVFHSCLHIAYIIESPNCMGRKGPSKVI